MNNITAFLDNFHTNSWSTS